jgi:hypothetical protein
LATLALAGCGSAWKPLDVGRLRETRPKTLLLVTDPNGAFFVSDSHLRPGEAGGGLYEGATFVRENALSDPALVMGEELARSLAEELALERTFVVEEPPPPGHPIVKRLPRAGGDLLLLVRTTIWGICLAPGRWTRWTLRYEAEVTLTDTRDGRVVASGACVGDDPDILKAEKYEYFAKRDELTAGARTYPELVGHQAAWLKRDLRRAADRCEADFASRLFALQR